MKYISFFVIILIITTSCRTNKVFYNKVLRNKTEFNNIANYLIKNNLLDGNISIALNDGDSLSLRSKCVYQENKDDYISSFLKKYNLSEICNYIEYPSLIYFSKDASPYFSTSRVVYDNGVSFLREKIKNGEKTSDEKKMKIIDSKLIFIFK